MKLAWNVSGASALKNAATHSTGRSLLSGVLVVSFDTGPPTFMLGKYCTVTDKGGAFFGAGRFLTAPYSALVPDAVVMTPTASAFIAHARWRIL